MVYRTYKKMVLPGVALGTWAWGTGINAGKSVFGNAIPKEQLREVFHEAVSKGLILWDTAPIYGFGTSEKWIGEFAQNQKSMLSTKFSPLGIQRKSALAASYEKSCKRLLKSNVDIYWVHTPAHVRKWTEALIPLMREERIKIAGVSNHNLAQIQEVVTILAKAEFGDTPPKVESENTATEGGVYFC